MDPNVPLFGFIGRLDYQKGVDLIRDNYDWLMGEGAQLVFLGSGMAELENSLRDMENRSVTRHGCSQYDGSEDAQSLGTGTYFHHFFKT